MLVCLCMLRETLLMSLDTSEAVIEGRLSKL